MEETVQNPSSKADEPVKKKNTLSVLFSKLFNFTFNLFVECIKWFFRGLSSFASAIIGYFLVLAAILTGIFAVSSGQIFEKDTEVFTSSEEIYRDYGGEDRIALINLNGVIVENDNVSNPIVGGFNTITPDKVEMALNNLRNESRLKAVIFNLSSPGGSPIASDRIFEIITDFKKNKNVPVVVLMGDVVASGGYFISAPADYIIANPATLTGSIGVIFETYNLEGLYEKVGVKKEVYKAGKYKDILSDARQATDEEKVMIARLMNDAYELFLKRVSEGRKLPFEKVQTLAEGKLYSGIEAKEAGLIDDVGTLNSAISQAAFLGKTDKFKVIKVRSVSFLDELLSGIGYTFNKILLNYSLPNINNQSYQILYKLN